MKMSKTLIFDAKLRWPYVMTYFIHVSESTQSFFCQNLLIFCKIYFLTNCEFLFSPWNWILNFQLSEKEKSILNDMKMHQTSQTCLSFWHFEIEMTVFSYSKKNRQNNTVLQRVSRNVNKSWRIFLCNRF